MEKVKVEKVDHVMICVRNLDEATAFYSNLLGIEFYRVEPLALGALGIGAAALDFSGIELVEATSPQGEAARFIEAVGEATWGIAFKVPDLEEAIAGMQARGIRLIAKEEGATRKVAIFNLADAFNVLIKLVEYIPEYSVADLDVVTLSRQQHGLKPAATPKVEKIDHIIFHVEDLDKATSFFADLFGTRFSVRFEHAMAVDGLGLELIEAEMPEPSQAQITEKRRAAGLPLDGIVFVSLKVTSYDEIAARLISHGSKVGRTRALPTRKVGLFDPAGALGAGLEIIEYKSLAHPIACLEMRRELAESR